MSVFNAPGPRKALLACLLLALIVSACQPVTAASPAVTITPVQIATQAPSQTPSKAASTASPTTTNQVITISLDDSVPRQLKGQLRIPESWSEAPDNTSARLHIGVYHAESSSNLKVSKWIYALVAPFPTIADEVTLADLQSAWKGAPPKGLPFTTLLAEPSTEKAFEALWGKPSSIVQVELADKLADAAWAAKTAWAIVPFEQIEPRWKVIAVDGQSPMRKEFDPAKYALTVPFALQGDPNALESFRAEASLPDSNRLADKLTTVVVTGTTALVRGTASLMEQRGLDYPAQDIGDWLRQADILHISNEIAFDPKCPAPYDWPGLKFCSRPKYIKLLEDIGTDVIELTGDHFQDWGPDAVRYSMDLYRQEGWQTYGGGDNIEEAQKPALFEHNGTKIAFLGCNAKAKGYATVSDTTPGTLHCNMDEMVTSVKQLRAEGYLPIFTFQHLEYYAYTIHPLLQKDFRAVAEAGAVIVSGSQAHQPHGFEFYDGALLHYGLGNLFFDQTNQGDAPRTAFIDRHVFYNGKYLGVELLTIYLVDFARSRPMTTEERGQLLTNVFNASGWK